MNIDAEISLYPLRTSDLSGPIHGFLQRIHQAGLEVHPGPMSSRITGECSELFRTIGNAFESSAEQGDVVLVFKVSNACR